VHSRFDTNAAAALVAACLVVHARAAVDFYSFGFGINSKFRSHFLYGRMLHCRNASDGGRREGSSPERRGLDDRKCLRIDRFVPPVRS
jgi:hypothetical protein